MYNNNRTYTITLANNDCLIFEIMLDIILQQYDNKISENNNPFYHHTDYVPGFIMHTQLSRDVLPSLEDIIDFYAIQQLYIYFNSCNDDEIIQVILERNGSSSNRIKALQGYLSKVTANLMIDTINTFDEVWTFENISNDKTKFTRRMVNDDDDGDDDDDDDGEYDDMYDDVYDDEYDEEHDDEHDDDDDEYDDDYEYDDDEYKYEYDDDEQDDDDDDDDNDADGDEMRLLRIRWRSVLMIVSCYHTSFFIAL